MNIFQIWKDIGERVPFIARKGHWSQHSSVLITKVEIKKFPYGDAYGISLNNGFVNSKNEKLSSPGVYAWYLVSDNLPEINENISLKDIDESKNAIAYQIDQVLNFGKNQGYTIREVFSAEPQYLEWLIINKENFILSTDCVKKLKKMQSEYWFNRYVLLINYSKMR